MNNKFLDKVIEQIISETRIMDDKVYTPFFLLPLFSFSPLSLLPSSYLLSFFYIHCKEVYSLNKEETDYVWEKYKKGITALIDKKEPSHQEKG